MITIQWTKVYSDLARILLAFHRQNPNTAGERLYKLLYEDSVIREESKWLDRYRDQLKPSIDPVVFFSSFSDTNQNKLTRINRIQNYYRVLAKVPAWEDINFEGCPTPKTVSLMAVRTNPNQLVLWVTFHNVMQSGRAALNSDVFNKLKDIYGIDVVSFTIWLFWLNADVFIPLDRNTVRYLIREGFISHQPKTFYDYDNLLSIIVQKPIDLSRNAYLAAHFTMVSSAPPTKEQKFIPAVENGEQPSERQGNFRIIAVRPLAKLDPKFKKVLRTNKNYVLFNAYDLSKRNVIIYDPKKDILLYDQGELPVTLSAIVGKNGSGKSSITELIYLAVNNLAEKHHSIDTELQSELGVHLELYYLADFLYRITIDNAKIGLEKFQFSDNKYSKPIPIHIDDFDLEQFFYTIAINYSQYGLNSKHIGTWINNLFHKNDSYQAPIVINPYREEGVINVNTEESLTKSRLIANLLQPVLPDDENKNDHLRRLTDDDTAKSISLIFDESKFKQLYEYRERDENGKWKVVKRLYFTDTKPYFRDVLKALCKTFDIEAKLIPPTPDNPTTAIDYAFLYIVKKLISIAITYDQWASFFDAPGNFFYDNYKIYITKLNDDRSHITYKLRQAVNFIRKDHIRRKLKPDFKMETKRLPIDKLANTIADLSGRDTKVLQETIFMIPPSFFKIKIWFDTKGEFEKLSSGEKQRIYAVSSLAYHLINLNSINVQNDLIFYRYINVIFDEAELYFHPEMQRGFIKYLLSYIKRLELTRISGINICMITHSPFILSDIPHHNILFLGQAVPQIKTLGSNIHDLLAHSFFLEKGFMGDYVKRIVQEMIVYLTPEQLELKPLTETALINWDPEKARQVIDAIGEPLIRIRLDEMYKVKFEAMLTKAERIAALKNELLILEQ